MTFRKITGLALALAGLLALVAVSHGATVGKRTTLLVSPPPETGIASDGPSDNSSWSQDGRTVRYMGYDSTATNLVPGDTNGKKDVFVLTRGGGDGNLGGPLSIASVNSSGQLGNGDSQKPVFDGKNPHCVVFESTSSNLAKGDSGADSDVFLRDLKSKKTDLISDKGSGATSGTVDDECEFVTYSASGAVFVRDLEKDTTTKIASGSNPDIQINGKGVAYERGGQIRYIPFQRVFNKGNPKVKKTGKEILVSKGKSGQGNGTSSNPVLDSNGYYVAFQSTATNLCTGLCVGPDGADANGPVSDIYRATISSKAPTKDAMQMVSYSFAVKEQGNGPSIDPDMSGAGENVVFASEATNLKESSAILVADANGPISDIYYWNFPRGRKEGNVSRESRNEDQRESGSGQPYNGPSGHPSTSQRSNYIGFTSFQAGASAEKNGPGIADVFARFLGGGPPGST